MKKLLIALFLFPVLTASAQSVYSVNATLDWDETPVVHASYPDENTSLAQFSIYRFAGASYQAQTPSLPLYNTVFPVPGYGQLRAELSNQVWESFEKETSEDDSYLAEQVSIQSKVAKERLQYKGSVNFIPIRRNGNGFERLVSFTLNVSFRSESYPVASGREGYPTTSVLADADDNPVYKIPISETGMYKLDQAYLEALGINTAELDPRQIKIYGNGGGMLAEEIDSERLNDLAENPIKVIGEEDGNFDAGDAVIFYAEGPHKWIYDETGDLFKHQTNPYTFENYYFLKVSSDTGLRVSDSPAANLSSTSYTTSQFDDYQIFEEEKVNLLDQFNQGYGTGQMWFGDSYKLQRDRSYSDKFSFPNLTQDPATITIAFAARAGSGGTRIQAEVDGNSFSSSTFSSVNLSDIDRKYAQYKEHVEQINLTSENPTVSVSYPNVGVSEGWLDFITIKARRNLIMSGDVMTFRDTKSLGEASTRFNLTGDTQIEIWDITNPESPTLQNTEINDGGGIVFGTNTAETLKQFIAFRPNAALNIPENGTQITAQNLHSIDQADMLIVYHPIFASQVQQLAEHRADYSNLNVATASIDQVYNEFSSGRVDPGAIREMAKMLFERNPENFRYLLLFGDGSFDARGVALTPGETNHNYIPVYETRNSLDPVQDYPSDDFFGLISEGEGTARLTGILDLAVGRIPVRTESQAQAMVDKIIGYDVDKEAMGDWRNDILHMADNGDSNIHQRDSDEIAEKARDANKNLNISKIYLDSYQRVATTGDARVPEANAAMNREIFQGQLAVIYLGHGGPGGWTQERVLRKEDIFSWENENKLPLFMTATCTFAGYDAASDVSAGEEVFLNENGGAIALYSTVRPVYASQNANLTDSAAFKLFRDPNARNLPMGEVLRLAKNTFSSTNPTNQRKFQMIGDPSQNLALPKLNVVTTQINDLDVNAGVLDTLSALEKVTIKGEIRNQDGSLASDFNGVIFPTVFDKIKTLTTLGQIQGSLPMSYLLQNNVIFKGRASVTEGQFSFTFVVPKDIDFNYGTGKISYYAAADDDMTDAAGASCDLIIGGINEDALTDDQGPEVEVFMNTFEWVSGSTTNENPVLLARLTDDLGINVVGNSIGHDLTGTLDNDSQQSYLLNDFYEAELDDYTSGTVRFPLNDIAPGYHEIKVKAWDTANNPAEGSTEFIVAESAAIALTNVLNYPNPFVNRTCFMFDHNQTGDLDVLVSIYTIAGRLVKTIEERIDGGTGKVTRENCLEWDGRDDFGDELARGVYLYKVRLRNSTTGLVSEKKESEFEKLVILK